jgi:hypothetical protein
MIARSWRGVVRLDDADEVEVGRLSHVASPGSAVALGPAARAR